MDLNSFFSTTAIKSDTLKVNDRVSLLTSLRSLVRSDKDTAFFQADNNLVIVFKGTEETFQALTRKMFEPCFIEGMVTKQIEGMNYAVCDKVVFGPTVEH